MDLILTLVAGLIGVGVGAYLARRNERASTSDRLLAEAVNDMMAAIADVASRQGPAAAARYASATSRIALHASPDVVAAFRAFQDDATTDTEDGRARLIAALQLVRDDLGHKPANPADLRTLLFGPDDSRRPPELRN